MVRRNLLQENAVLAALGTGDSETLRPALEPVTLRAGEVLSEPGRPLREVYFPVSAIISLMNVSDDGVSSGLAMIGNDGMLGIGLLLGVETARSRAVVHRAGEAFRIQWAQLEQPYHQSLALQQLLLRYTHALTMQLAQNAVCNRRHVVRQRLSSWLLWMLDHSPSSQVYATHGSMAALLGVRREAITEALGRLQESGLLKGGRGRVEVLDRHGLQFEACECYHTIREEHEQMLDTGKIHWHSLAGNARPQHPTQSMNVMGNNGIP